MKRILFVATVAQGHISIFHKPILHQLQCRGYETHVAAYNDYAGKQNDLEGCVFHEIEFSRIPFRKQNIKAYVQLKKLINETHFDIIHCHTPVGGVLARLAAKASRKKGTKVFYTAHGFHFFKGAPIKNWLVYYPIEKLCSHMTDVLVTINREDYEFAKKRMNAKKTVYLPGVGIDLEKIAKVEVTESERRFYRKILGIPEQAFLLLSVGEVNLNKNFELIIRALAKLRNPNIHYVIAGKGPLFSRLSQVAKEEKVDNQVHMLGYRDDILILDKTADAFCFPSKREGLPVALMEAIASKLPVICSDIRGNDELTEKENRFSPNCAEKAADKILACMRGELNRYIDTNYDRLKAFELQTVLERQLKLYE